ncbi:MAG: cation:proton antiporter, partial [Brucella anthropi]
IERGQDAAANVLDVTMEAYGDDEEEEDEDEVGAVLPATLAVLGTFFGICAILLIGLPPFSGFIAKFLILAAVFNGDSPTPQLAMPVSPASWALVALLLLSGLSALIAMTRTGIRTFWASLEGNVPRVLVREVVPIAGLLAICLALTIAAGPAMSYMDETARSLHNPASYISSVLNAPRAGTETEGAQ